MDRLRIFQIGWSVFFLGLVMVTWPLWLGNTQFPRVPLIEGIGAIPWLGATSAIILLAGCVAQWSPYRLAQRWGLYGIVVGLAVSFLIDQHRLQAWAYQFFFVAIFFLAPRAEGGDPERASWRFRWLVCGIYLYSCLSKLDASFVSSVGPQMLKLMGSVVGLSTEDWPDGIRQAVVLLLPLLEGLLGIGLWLGMGRRLLVILAVAMHLALVGVVGPMGWQHQWGVVVWNLFFAFQAIVLFWPSTSTAIRQSDGTEIEDDRDRAGAELPSWMADLGLAFVLLFPLTASLGICDHWLAWELYAPRTSRAQVFVAAGSAEGLPETVRIHLESPDAQGWQELDLAAWSLTERRVPVYPEDRFQIAVARALKWWIPDDRSVRVLWRSTADRWNGRRQETYLRGYSEVDRFSQRFWWNTQPVPAGW